jgi:excisionase family DNA binding protein
MTSPEVPQPAPLLWSTTDAAARLGVSRAHIYELLARRELASLKLGARRLIPDDELRRFIAAKLAETADW